jgi:hypothetical protein
MPRGRPRGAISRKTYLSLVAQHFPSRFKEVLKKEVKQEVKQEIKKRGRPKSSVNSMRVLGGHLRVRLAKAKNIRLGTRQFSV